MAALIIRNVENYIKNPDAFDNKGMLKNAPTPMIRQKIIYARVKYLENEIGVFEKNIKDLGGVP